MEHWEGEREGERERERERERGEERKRETQSIREGRSPSLGRERKR